MDLRNPELLTQAPSCATADASCVPVPHLPTDSTGRIPGQLNSLLGGFFSGLPGLGNNQLLALWSPWTRAEPFPGHCESCSSSFDFLVVHSKRGERASLSSRP